MVRDYPMKKIICVVGNGATSVDQEGNAYINGHTLEFLLDLQKNGYQVDFVQPFKKRVENEDILDAKIPVDKINIIYISKSNFKDIFRLMIRIIYKYDLVYLFFPGKLSRIVSKICHLFNKDYGIYLRGEKLINSDHKIFVRSSFINSVSKSLVHHRLKEFVNKTTAIRPMLDYTLSDIDHEKGFEVKRKVKILYVGRLEVDKGVLDLIHAARILDEKNITPFEMTFIGGGPLFAELVKLSEEIKSNIRILGHLSSRKEVQIEYQRSNIFILPTYHEGFPRVLYEAMIHSNLIITTMVGGIPGIMIHEENCLEIPVNDPYSISKVLEKVVSNPDQYSHLVENGKKTVSNILSKNPNHLEAFESNSK